MNKKIDDDVDNDLMLQNEYSENVSAGSSKF